MSQPLLPPTSPSIPQIIHTPSPKPPASLDSSDCSSVSSEDLSSDGDEYTPSAVMDPGELDYLTHGDLRSPGREFTRERSLRKKPHHRPSSASVHSPSGLGLGVQPAYEIPDDEDKPALLSPEERAKERKKVKKQAKAAKRKALKSQETVKIPRKREDRKREDELAEMEQRMAQLQTTGEGEGSENEHEEESGTPSTLATRPNDRQRRRSSNTPVRPAKPRKTSSSTQGGSISGASGPLKSPKIGVETEDPASMAAKRNSPHPNAKYAAAYTQYNVEEGIYERSSDIDAQMAALAKLEAANASSRSAKLAKGFEEIDRRARERRQQEALKGVVEAAQEKYEDKMLTKFYESK